MLEASIFSDGDETEMRGEKTGKKKKGGDGHDKASRFYTKDRKEQRKKLF